jgi:hypothetical protein
MRESYHSDILNVHVAENGMIHESETRFPNSDNGMKIGILQLFRHQNKFLPASIYLAISEA